MSVTHAFSLQVAAVTTASVVLAILALQAATLRARAGRGALLATGWRPALPIALLGAFIIISSILGLDDVGLYTGVGLLAISQIVCLTVLVWRSDWREALVKVRVALQAPVMHADTTPVHQNGSNEFGDCGAKKPSLLRIPGMERRTSSGGWRVRHRVDRHI